MYNLITFLLSLSFRPFIRNGGDVLETEDPCEQHGCRRFYDYE
jgi:hypothetical protein